MRLHALGPALLAITMLSSQAHPQALTETDRQAVESATRGYIGATVDGDWDAAVAYFHEEAVRLPMNQPAERGREAIRAHFEAVDSITNWSVHSLEIGGSGDVAYVRLFFTITAYVTGLPESFTYTGKQLLLLERQADGSWLIVTDMWNADSMP